MITHAYGISSLKIVNLLDSDKVEHPPAACSEEMMKLHNTCI